MAGFYTVVSVTAPDGRRQASAKWWVTRRKADKAKRRAEKALVQASRLAMMRGETPPPWNVYVLPAA